MTTNSLSREWKLKWVEYDGGSFWRVVDGPPPSPGDDVVSVVGTREIASVLIPMMDILQDSVAIMENVGVENSVDTVEGAKLMAGMLRALLNKVVM